MDGPGVRVDPRLCLLTPASKQLTQKGRSHRKSKTEKIVVAAAPTIKKVAAPKKGDSSWVRLLKGAASTAVDLAPALLPLLLGSHAPTMAAAARNPTAFASAPLAAGIGTTGNLCGIKNMTTTSTDARGNVSRLTVTTMDLVTSISTSGASVGDVLFEAYLSPLDPAFIDTKFSMFGAQYERYKIKKCCLVYEPTCPATTAGSIAGAVFVDPVVDLPAGGGLENLRIVGSQPGSDTWNVWAAGCYSAPKSPELYTDPGGTDIRLTTGGRVLMVAGGSIASGELGNLFLACEVEYSVPSLAEQVTAGVCGFWSATQSIGAPAGGTWYYTVFHSTAPTFIVAENLLGGDANLLTSADFSDAGGSPVSGGTALVNLSPGAYMVTLNLSTGVNLSDVVVAVTNEAQGYGAYLLSQGVVEKVVTASALICYVFVSIPANCPKNLPLVYFSFKCSAAGSQAAQEVCVVKMREELFADNLLSAAPFPMNNRKRALFYARTQQGREAKMLQDIAALKCRAIAPATPCAPTLTAASAAASVGARRL